MMIIFLSIAALRVNSAPESFMSFDFTNSSVETGFDDWLYIDKGANPCFVYNGTKQSKFCNNEGFKFFPYYNERNSDHMGWLQFGYIDASKDYSVSGSSLKVHLTGGYYRNGDGEPTQDGKEIRSKSDFQDESDLGKQPVLPGDISLYYKGPEETTKSPELQGKNRLTVWVLMPRDSVKFDEYSTEYQKSPTRTFSFYPFIGTTKGFHYYHFASNIPMGGWTKIQFDASPTHKNSGAPNELNAYPEGGLEYSENGSEYYSNIAGFALRADFSKYLPADSIFYIDEITTDYVLYENEETIRNVAIGYSPTSKLFDISLQDKYRCPDCSAEYEVRYSFEPITNSNFGEAFIPKRLINFDRDKTNQDGRIFKPNNGYNQIWGAIEVRDEHLPNIKHGSTVYFAIKDMTQRQSNLSHQEDSNEVEVPGLGLVKKSELIKSISYQIFDVHYPVEVDLSNIESPVVGMEYRQKLVIRGGKLPYNIEVNGLPDGLTLEQDEIKGIAQHTESSFLTLSITDSLGNSSDAGAEFQTIPRDALKTPSCKVVADFDEIIPLPSPYYSESIADKYTGEYKTGMTTVVGQNRNYNYQGVKGIGFDFYPGDTVRLTWRNNSAKSIVFAPRVSFSSEGRFSDEESAMWSQLQNTSIDVGESKVEEVQISSNLYATTINVNSNHAGNKEIILEKIEIVSSRFPAEDYCDELKFPNSSYPLFDGLTKRLLVDFEQSDELSLLFTPSFNEIFKDKYTDYYLDGLSIVVGEHPSYNYQGIRGEGIEVYLNNVIKVYWKNYNNHSINFTPKISFDFQGRPIEGGRWQNMSETFIESANDSSGLPGSAASYYIIDNASLYLDLINVNFNFGDNKGLVLDRIELLN